MNKEEKIRLMKLKYAMMAASAYSLAEDMGIEGSPFKPTSKTPLTDPQINELVHHITEHPADPLYNSLIFFTCASKGKIILESVRKQFIQHYPQKEVLYYKGTEFNTFLQSQNAGILANFHKTHPNLLAVCIEDLTIKQVPIAGQTKMALFLKQLVTGKIQVVVSTTQCFEMPALGQGGPLSRELWSWYLSGRIYNSNYHKQY